MRYYLWNRETEEYLHNVVYGRDKRFWEYYLDEATNSVWWSRRARMLAVTIQVLSKQLKKSC